MVSKRGREGESAGARRVGKRFFRVLSVARDADFFAYTACYTTKATALCSYECYGTYGAIYLSF